MRDEKVLVERANNGEVSAFREIVERYQKKIYYLAYDLTGNHHSAEDLSQEVFIKVFRSLKNFRGDAKFSSWLYRITVNTWISQYRKKSSTALKLWDDFSDSENKPDFYVPADNHHNPEQFAEASLIQQQIEKALAKLSPRERSIFVMRHYNDLKQKDIADILGITVGTVKSTLFRAIKRLQNELSFYRKYPGLEG